MSERWPRRRKLLPGLLLAALASLQTLTMAQNPASPPAQPAPPAARSSDAADDPFLWLEDVQGERALAWARERNAESQALLTAGANYAPLRQQLLDILNSKARIPHVARRGPWLYNFWQDEAHQRGLWRRTSLAEYRKPEPQWQVMLDLDALARSENENWVWGGASCLGPRYQRCLVSLSRGGADAKVVREFDLRRGAFVSKQAFTLPEAKSEVEWIDADTIYVGTDFGPGSLTDSGYPRVVKRWKRGTPLTEAVTVFEGEKQDVSVSVSVDHTPGFERTLFSRATDFFNTRKYFFDAGQLKPLDLPTDASISFANTAGGAHDTMLIELRSAWAVAGHSHPGGSLLAIDAAAFERGERRFSVLFEPTPTRSLAGHAATRKHILVNVLDNVASRLEEWQRTPQGWARREIDAPFPGSLGVAPLHDPLLKRDPLGEAYLLSHSGFLTPDSLSLAHTGKNQREPLKALPAFFDAAGARVEQAFATSLDGTRVPYFVVWPAGARADGNNPTLLYGYGGFEISLQPWYPASFGAAWLQRGGVLVVANIRGGGEFGPAWHQAAQMAHKQRSYDDFIAVAEDLIARQVTQPAHLGIEGGSNGGLLVGAVFTQRPELFNAVVCKVPLLDMKRYHLLLAGASWMAEYGNPELPEDWQVISRYSPYQNVKPGIRYPKVLFTTSTRDDRVHPGHARKMAARMLAQGHPVLYYENMEGGHGGAADNAQRAHLQALEFSYLWQQLGRKPE
jgi:prolyl oligopeptidase